MPIEVPQYSNNDAASLTCAFKDALSQFCDLASVRDKGPDYFHLVTASIHQLSALVARLESAGLSRDEILPWCDEARRIHGHSPFIQRLQRWPRGYQGDFETVEYLLEQQPKVESGTVEHALEYLALSSPIAQQHRNKMRHQSELVLALPRRTADQPWRVLSLACGSCPDLRQAVNGLSLRDDVRFVLCDGDADALEAARKGLGPLVPRCDFVHGNVLTSTRELEKHGPYDLVLCGGLFDYLPARRAVFLLRQIWRHLLADKGRCFLTNIITGNPYRHWVEYMADWQLIERSAEDMRALIAQAWDGRGEVSLVREGSGLAWLMEARKAHS